MSDEHMHTECRSVRRSRSMRHVVTGGVGFIGVMSWIGYLPKATT